MALAYISDNPDYPPHVAGTNSVNVRSRLLAFAVIGSSVIGSSASAQVVFSENFNTATQTTGGWTLASGFWPAQNNSDNPQPYSANGGAWGPGGTLFNPPDSPPNGSYFATDTTATGNTNGTVSDWLLTPVLTFHNGDIIKFATRTRSPEEGPSRLEVRISTGGASTNVGTGSAESDVGLFTLLVGTINPNLTAGAYPESWAAGQESFMVTGLSGTQTGRIAFRTSYTNGGFGGPNGDTVGLDTVSYTLAPAPEPGTLSLVAAGLLGVWRWRRRGNPIESKTARP